MQGRYHVVCPVDLGAGVLDDHLKEGPLTQHQGQPAGVLRNGKLGTRSL